MTVAEYIELRSSWTRPPRSGDYYIVSVPRPPAPRAPASTRLALSLAPRARVERLDPDLARREAARTARNAEDQQLRTRLLSHDARMRRRLATPPPGWTPARSW